MSSFTVDALRALGLAVFAASKVSPENAAPVVEALIAAELDGVASHGFSRIPFYADQALSGKVNGRATPAVSLPRPAAVTVDACNGFAFPAIAAGLEAAMRQAKSQGVCGLGVTRSHHCGALGHFADQAARAGFMSLAFANTPSAMAPWGGSKGTFGTNPLAFGCPRSGNAPIVVDLSLSKVARGKVMMAKQKGESIPEGWALDASGKPTTDPAAALAGTMTPLGDAKGAALALVVEILAATLTGANHAFEASSFFEAEGPPPGTGQFFLLIDTKAFNPAFPARLETLCGEILSQGGARIPGDRRHGLRAKYMAEGVTLPDALVADLKKRAGMS